MERLDRNLWKQYQSAMQDALKFVDLMNSVDLDVGFIPDVYFLNFFFILALRFDLIVSCFI